MKSTLHTISLFILMFYSSMGHARLFLDISVLNKKGIDIGLTLGSELHSREEVRAREDIRLAMKSGLSVLLRASFNEEVESGKEIAVETEAKVEKESLKKKKENSIGDDEETPKKAVAVIGPSSKVIIRGRVIGVNGEIVKDFFDEPLVVTLGETKVVTYSKDSQLVELKIKPHIN